MSRSTKYKGKAVMPNLDSNRETLARLQDFLNNPESKYLPSEIWSDSFIEKRPWPFQVGNSREGLAPNIYD
jgi:hypothetical protein